MDVVVNDFKIKVFCYHCDDCDERFYIEKISQPHHLSCPYCRCRDIAISSGHLDELNK